MKIDLDPKDINKRINKTYCLESFNALKDSTLIEEYKNANSTKNRVINLKKILKEENIDDEKINNIIDKYLPELVPAGTKGVIRGNKFNKIVSKKINDFSELKNDRFQIETEKQHPHFKVSEIPDFFIYDNVNKKIIIGMNQLDLWGGGQQFNRGSKYVLDDKQHNNEKFKLLSVVCYRTHIHNKNNKKYHLFNKGFQYDRLCYLNDLERIIKEYFNLL